MEIKVTGRKMQVTDALRAYAQEKVGGAMKVFEIDPMSAEVVLHVEKNPSNPKNAVCEVTLRTKGHVIRVEEAEEEMYAAIDLAADKTARQLRKFKTRVVDHRNRDRVTDTLSMETAAAQSSGAAIAEDDEEAVVRVKEIDLEPMTEEEALIETDLSGHDFYVYIDAKTGLTNVIYHRKGGGYGILKPRIETAAEA